jgi:hypothetical protein
MANGRLSRGSLSSIPGGQLEHNAAAAWNDMRQYIGSRTGVWIRPLGGASSYRSYAQQSYFWNLYKSGRGNVAAVPGTSNNGWGRAVDVASPAMARAISRVMGRFGWSHAEGARVGEWWHYTYVGGAYKPKTKPFRNLRMKSQGARVKWVQRRLRAKGFKSVKVTGFYGEATRNAVRRFQRKHRLTADGVVGRATWRALSR